MGVGGGRDPRRIPDRLAMNLEENQCSSWSWLDGTLVSRCMASLLLVGEVPPHLAIACLWSSPCLWLHFLWLPTAVGRPEWGGSLVLSEMHGFNSDY